MSQLLSLRSALLYLLFTNSAIMIFPTVDSVNDLGVIFDSKLSFNSHIADLRVRALKLRGLVQRNCSSLRDVLAFALLYKSLVLPLLDYGSFVWSPDSQVATDTLESVQHKVHRYLSFVSGRPMSYLDHNYEYIMNLVHFQLLSVQRVTGDLIFLFKLINHFVDSSNLLSLVKLRVPGRNTRLTEGLMLVRMTQCIEL